MSKDRRVVITGLGVVAPNAITIHDFHKALLTGTSGLKHQKELEELQFKCQVAGKPQLTQEIIDQHFTALQQRGLLATGLMYGVISAKQAFENSGIDFKNKSYHEDIGVVFGTGQSGGDKFREAIHHIDDNNVRRLGSTSVIQTMSSGVSAWISGELGLGNWVTTNSSACSTGTEALLMGYDRIKSGKARGMLVGSCSDSGPYIWGGFDAMRILPTKYNDKPEMASRPFSHDACGFVPGSGAGCLVLETLESALSRKATIYAEVKGGHLNSGGQTNGGSMTAPNGLAVQACIKTALIESKIDSSQIDVINGHITATSKDGFEVKNWSAALNRSGKDFPFINSFKSTIGHCLAASGSIELVGSTLQLHHQVVYPNINISQLHPEIVSVVDKEKVPLKPIKTKIHSLAKASFGFGDVNACAILSTFKP